ncbi:hypothetical protein JCM11641_006790 [Rhodosporidiobolus odoratus]
MDPDPRFYAQHLSEPSPPSPVEPPAVPLPPIQLPSPPRPSLSPSVSRVFQRPTNDKPPTMNGGLDLSQPASPTGGARWTGGGTENALESDIARSRADRAARLARQHSSDDPRDTASTRQNILSLVSSGQSALSGASSNGAAPSLAQFMGGGAARRVHKVNQGMTEQEREETERLEKEMAATRARWGSKGGNEEATAPKPGGLSLADLMRGGKGGASSPPSLPSAPAVDEPKRWQPSSTNSTPSPAPAPVPTIAQKDIDPPSPYPPSTPSPALVEAKVISRAPPPETQSPPSTAPAEFGTLPSSSPIATLAAGDEPPPGPPVADASPAASQAPRSAPQDTLTRLRSRSIVAERLKWGETKSAETDAPAAPASPSLGGGGGESHVEQISDKADKRRSVLDRWGRDQPNAVEAPSSPSLKSPAMGGGPWGKSPSPVHSPPLGQLSEKDERKERMLDQTASPALIGVAKVKEVELPKDERVGEEGVAPKLVHVTASRARPAKSTPRTLASAASTAGAASSTPSSSAIASSPSPANAPAEAAKSPEKKGYTKPTWSAAPIAAKPYVSSPAPVEEGPKEVKHTRGFALPGLSSLPPRSLPSRSATVPVPASPSKTPSKATEIPASPARPSVRAAAMLWGQQKDEDAEREKEERMRAIKASYGVRAGGSPVKTRSEPLPAPVPVLVNGATPIKAPAVARMEVETKREDVPIQIEPPQAKPVPARSSPPPTPTPSAPSPIPSATKPTASASPASAPAAPSRTANVDLLTLLSQPSPSSASFPTDAQTLSLDIFHLNSPTPSLYPIEHNYLLYRSEVLGIVWRFSIHNFESITDKAEKAEKAETRAWIWRGDEAEAEGEMEKRFREKMLGKVDKVEVIKYKDETRELGMALEGQVTVCRGYREEFDHLEKRLYSVRDVEGIIFVEEVDLITDCLTSALAFVLSTPVEVFSWFGLGSLPSEQHSANQFAESIADGRNVTVCEEGSETALFWHSLEGGEYAGAYYWRYRPSYPSHRPSLLSFPPSSAPVPIPSLKVPIDTVSLLDGGYSEIWVIVPEVAKGQKEEIRRALVAAKEIGGRWNERGWEGRIPYHVITFPTLIPRDLPLLSRQLDLEALNAMCQEKPIKMNVYTAEEAEEELL